MSDQPAGVRAVSFEGDEENIRLSFSSAKENRNSVKSIMDDLDFLDESQVEDDDITTPILAAEHGMASNGNGKKSPPPSNSAPEKAKVVSWYSWSTTYTEDGIGLHLGLLVFAAICIMSAGGINITTGYATTSEWPVGAFASGIGIIAVAHWVLKKKQVFEPYCVIMTIAVISRALGNYKALAQAGLSGSLWCVVFGIIIRSSGFELTKGVFSGEFFVKIGVCLMNMDFLSVVSIGGPGLVVAWLDTLLVLATGVYLLQTVYKFDIKDSIVVAGATCICGSSAATALSSSIHEAGFEDGACKAIIAIMGVFNAPLMPLMPLAKTVFSANPAVVGAWIGGSIDSTGQVVASAEMGGADVLKTAVIIKMAQNILIGPLCLFFTGYFQGSFEPKILINRFPLFVVGFFITSTITTIILNNPDGHNTSQSSNGFDDASLSHLIIENSWYIAEWITLIGFACIGLEIDITKFLPNSANTLTGKTDKSAQVLTGYLMVQCIDILTTFGWAYLMFNNYNWSKNDEETPVDPEISL